MSQLLRERLVGAWRLFSYVEKDVDTGEEHSPMGKNPEGIIMYTPDGYMSAQLCTPGRKKFSGGDMYRGQSAEYVQAGSTYMAYSGPFYVNEAKQSLEHEMNVSFFPNWKGQRQVRVVSIDGDVLHLSTDTPQVFDGGRMTASLLWRRATPNL